MADKVSTLNAPGDSSPSDETLNGDGASSTPVVLGDGLISTTDFVPEQKKGDAENGKPDGEGGNGEDAGKPAAEGKKPGEDDSDPDKKGKSEYVPYDRFKEKVDSEKRLTDELSKANQLIAELKANPAKAGAADQQTQDQQTQDQQTHAPQLEYIDMSKKTDDELTDWFDEKPKEFMGNLARQVIHEATGYIMNQLNAMGSKSAFEKNVGDFASTHEGFQDMKTSGQLDAFIKTHPGHNEFSAYHALTEDNRKAAEQQRIDAAVAAAVEKVKTEFTKNQKAKQSLRPVGSGAPSHSNGNDNELNDTKTQGGLISVIARRLERSRERAAQ